LSLTPEDRSAFETWVRAGKTERRPADRAKVILAAAEGQSTIEIARSQPMRPATVSKWRVRFSSVHRCSAVDSSGRTAPSAAPLVGATVAIQLGLDR
jgi:hypothetical protein